MKNKERIKDLEKKVYYLYQATGNVYKSEETQWLSKKDLVLGEVYSMLIDATDTREPIIFTQNNTTKRSLTMRNFLLGIL